jgi:hypothetical protein
MTLGGGWSVASPYGAQHIGRDVSQQKTVSPWSSLSVAAQAPFHAGSGVVLCRQRGSVPAAHGDRESSALHGSTGVEDAGGVGAGWTQVFPLHTRLPLQ